MQHSLHSLYQSAQDYVDYLLSKRISIKDVETICLTLGPYRNLTTLTAAMMFLHPSCQVLNHGGERIFKMTPVNFLDGFTIQKLNNFAKYAAYISQSGERGYRGGSITYSHAFDEQYDTSQLYKTRNIVSLKDSFSCLYWKESFRVTKLLRNDENLLGALVNSDIRLKFIHPIRNPIDCAFSNLHNKHINLFEGLNSTTDIKVVLNSVLEELLWFSKNETNFPNRFVHYFEHTITHETISTLAKILNLEPHDNWIKDVISLMKINPSAYEKSNLLIEWYCERVTSLFSDNAHYRENLLKFTQ